MWICGVFLEKLKSNWDSNILFLLGINSVDIGILLKLCLSVFVKKVIFKVKYINQ